MPYYYSNAAEHTTNGSANTDSYVHDLKTASANAGLRAYIRKLWAGCRSNAIDNQVRLRIVRLATLGTYASGTGLTPAPLNADTPAASAAVSSTTPVPGTATFVAVPLVQIAYNTRGTGLWAAFTDDEMVAVTGANNAVNGIAVVVSQATGASVVVPYEILHQE